jgi:hypothetical protein
VPASCGRRYRHRQTVEPNSISTCNCKQYQNSARFIMHCGVLLFQRRNEFLEWTEPGKDIALRNHPNQCILWSVGIQANMGYYVASELRFWTELAERWDTGVESAWSVGHSWRWWLHVLWSAHRSAQYLRDLRPQKWSADPLFRQKSMKGFHPPFRRSRWEPCSSCHIPECQASKTHNGNRRVQDITVRYV